MMILLFRIERKEERVIQGRTAVPEWGEGNERDDGEGLQLLGYSYIHCVCPYFTKGKNI